MPVYIARAPSGLTKIGFSREPRARVRSISRECGEKFEIVRQIQAGLDTERWLQRRFEAHRERGRDWFRFADEMLTIEPPTEIRYRVHGNDGPPYWRLRAEAKYQDRLRQQPLIEALCGVPPGTFAVPPIKPRTKAEQRDIAAHEERLAGERARQMKAAA